LGLGYAIKKTGRVKRDKIGAEVTEETMIIRKIAGANSTFI